MKAENFFFLFCQEKSVWFATSFVHVSVHVSAVKKSTLRSSKLSHVTTAKHDHATVNPPDSVKETLSWLQVPLWYILCWPFLDHIGWLYACCTAVWQELHKRLYCNSFPPLSSHPFCNDTYNLMFSRKVGWCTHIHYLHTLTGPGYPTNMGDVTAERNSSTRLWIFSIFFFFLLTLNWFFFSSIWIMKSKACIA